VRQNLVVNSVFPGTHNGNSFTQDTRITGGIEVVGQSSIVRDNVVGGSARAGFIVGDLPCSSLGVYSADDRRYFDGNEAHGSHFTVRALRMSRSCLELRGMFGWKASEYGLLAWTTGSVKIEDHISIDERVALGIFLWGTPSRYHRIGNQQVEISNSLLVGYGANSDCSEPLPTNRWRYSWGRGAMGVSRVGLFIPMFVSSGPMGLDNAPPHSAGSSYG